MAESGHCTGRGFAETHTVCGCRDVVDSADAVVYRGYDFVHADNKYNLLRSVDQGSDMLPLPSILISSPSFVMALELMK